MKRRRATPFLILAVLCLCITPMFVEGRSALRQAFTSTPYQVIVTPQLGADQYDPDYAPLDLGTEYSYHELSAVVLDEYGNPIPFTAVSWSTGVAKSLATVIDPNTMSDPNPNDPASSTLHTDDFGSCRAFVRTTARDDLNLSVTAQAGMAQGQRPVKFIPDIWPTNSYVLASAPDAAERNGARTVPFVFTILKKPANPVGFMMSPKNWEPIPNLHVRFRVGTVQNGSAVEMPTWGELNGLSDVWTKTNADGQIKFDFKGKNGAAEGGQVLILWTDRMDRPCLDGSDGWSFTLLTQSQTDQSSHTYSTSLFSGPEIKYKDSLDLQNSVMRSAFTTALNDWDSGAYGNKFEFQSDPKVGPNVGNGNVSGFEVFENYSTSTAGADRPAYGYTVFPTVNNAPLKDQYVKVTFCKETLIPDPTYQVPVDDTTNARRSFDYTPPAIVRALIAAHELGHVLGLDHHTKVDGQRSVTCIGRGTFTANDGAFSYWVNGVSNASGKDREAISMLYP